MYPAICSYDEQAFDDMNEESEKVYFIMKKSLRPVPSQDMVEQARKYGGFWPQQGYPGNTLRPREQGGQGSPDEAQYGIGKA